MQQETLTERDDLVIRKLTLERGEGTPWHTDTCHRFTVIVQGDKLEIEYQDTTQFSEPVIVNLTAGDTGWDEPEPHVHRAINRGEQTYIEVVSFYRSSADVDPQPIAHT